MPSPLAAHWLLDPQVAYLNHGSYGATPRSVLDAQTAWRERMEREPVRFMTELEGRLDSVREQLAEFLGARAGGLAFVPNATTGVNTVLRSLALRPGDEVLATDHEYNACLNAADVVAGAAGARVVMAAVPFPLESPDQVVEAVLGRVSERTRIALLSHVTSATALIWPIERLVAGLRERGVESIVDGAHAPGMLPLRLDELGAGYYSGNGHKWLCSAKGAAFLWVRHDLLDSIRPLVISHGTNSPRRDRGRFRLEFDWTGTADPTAYLSLPAALEFGARLLPGGWQALMNHNRALCRAGREVIAAALGVAASAPDEMTGSKSSLEVPEEFLPRPAAPVADLDPAVTLPDDPLHEALFREDSIEVPVGPWPPTLGRGRRPMRLLRISAQAYNSIDDYERLADSLRRRRATT